MILGASIIVLVIASYFFWRLEVFVLQYLTTTCAQIGSHFHTMFKMEDGADTDAWLLSLLLGLTRYPTLVLGMAGFFLSVLSYLYDPFWMLPLKNFVLSTFFFLLVVRLLGVIMGSVMYGKSIETVIGSLES
jgi:hypothetical protein